jgi:hypothetical protein
MIIDTIAYIDSNFYHEAQYQCGNELLIVCADGRNILVSEVSEDTFLKLQALSSHEMVLIMIY